jgi:hypothetical protein
MALIVSSAGLAICSFFFLSDLKLGEKFDIYTFLKLRRALVPLSLIFIFLLVMILKLFKLVN